MSRIVPYIVFIYFVGFPDADKPDIPVTIIPVADGWANNSVNTVVFRKNSLVSFHDTQFISFYDKDRFVVLGKRRIGAKQWQLKKTNFQGEAGDAHKSISIMIDGAGYLHLAWDHHNNSLRYCRSLSPGSLELTEKMPMTGKFEDQVTYPEFYKLPSGNLLFFYRDGGSGRGNLVINQFDLVTKKWNQLHSNLIDGEGRRNAYWQACVDAKGTIHISWVWRETPDVASNHDLCYARSKDGGHTWEKSTGEQYHLPIVQASAEYAIRIPQKSELINQTSMFADATGHPFIATYYRDSGSSVPQYHFIYKKGKEWQAENLGLHKTSFSLSGGGTMRIPISRPQILARQNGKQLSGMIIFRDEERGNKASIAICSDIYKCQWKVYDLSSKDLGSWEPTYDTELWKEKGILNLFLQHVEQISSEGRVNIPPQPVEVLEWNFSEKVLGNEALGRAVR